MYLNNFDFCQKSPAFYFLAKTSQKQITSISKLESSKNSIVEWFLIVVTFLQVGIPTNFQHNATL